MMLVAEASGLDTAPMEGFDSGAVQRELNLPPESQVVALLAIGYAREPDKAYGGRISLPRFPFGKTRKSMALPGLIPTGGLALSPLQKV